MNETQQKGLITELQCQLFFTNKGYNVLLPICQDCRYDMVVDIQHTLYRIQVKTSRPNDSNVEGLLFNTVSSRMNHTEGNMKQKYDIKDIDFFATFFENKVYLIPVELCQGSTKRLIKKRSKYSNQQVDLMEDFEAEKVIQKIINKNPITPSTLKMVVAQYTLDGEYVNSFESYMAAAKSLGITSTVGSTHIGEVVRGKRKTAYNYIWKKIEN